MRSQENIRSNTLNSFELSCARQTSASVFGRLVDMYFDWRERSRQRRHLAGLDHHMLRDIGLSRADVDQEVSKPFWRI